MNQIYELKELQPNNRGLVALRQIQQGQKIMESQPMAWATLKLLKSEICNWCFKKNELFRSLCKSFYYCSKECQKNDWSIHKLECKIYQNMTNNKKLSVHKEIATEFVLNMRIALLIAQSPQFEKQFFEMISLQDYQPLEKRQYFQEMAVVILENIGQQKSQANLSRLLKQLNAVAVNAFTIQDFMCEMDGIGIGVFSPTHMINHGCQPNCTQYFDGRYLNIIANKVIEAKEQLTISYTNPLMMVDERRELLRSNYLFECFCELCQIQKMIETKYMYVLCPKCQNKLTKSKEPNENGQECCYFCQKCEAKLNKQQIQKRYQFVHNAIKEFDLLTDYLSIKKEFFVLRKIVSIEHPYFAEAIDKVYHATINSLTEYDHQRQQKMLEQAYILLKEEIKGLANWYRLQQGQQKNIRFFLKYAQFGKLCYNLGKLQKAFQYTELAYNLVKKCNLRNKYSEVAELEKRYEQIRIEMSISKSKSFNSS